MMNWFKFKAYIKYRFKARNAHGLHSPFLFDFYNEVIAANKEFYLFKRLRALAKAQKDASSLEGLFFLFRWVAFYKPSKVKLQTNNFLSTIALASPSMNKIVCNKPGYEKAELMVLDDLGISFEDETESPLIYLDDVMSFAIASVRDYSCLIIKCPHENERVEKKWKELLKLKDVTISIDVFHFGILLVDKNQAKQHFVVRM